MKHILHDGHTRHRHRFPGHLEKTQVYLHVTMPSQMYPVVSGLESRLIARQYAERMPSVFTLSMTFLTRSGRSCTIAASLDFCAGERREDSVPAGIAES